MEENQKQEAEARESTGMEEGRRKEKKRSSLGCASLGLKKGTGVREANRLEPLPDDFERRRSEQTKGRQSGNRISSYNSNGTIRH